MAVKNLLQLFTSEILVSAMGLLFGILVARGFGLEAKGSLAAIAALVGLGSAISSLGVSYSAVKLGGSNTNRIFLNFSFFSSTFGLLFLSIYSIQNPHQFDINNHILELYIILFLTIYNLQSLAFIVSRQSRNYYSFAILLGQFFAFSALLLMFFYERFDAIWITLAIAIGQFLVSFYYLTRVHLLEGKVSMYSTFKYVKLSLNQAPIILITAISIHIPVLILTSFSIIEVGIYSVGVASTLVIGKIPRLLNGMSLGGIMFNDEESRTQFLQLQFLMIFFIALFHLSASYLIQALYGSQFLPAVSVSIILAYSMLPLTFTALGEARMIVFEKYNALIAYKFISCSLLVISIYSLQFFDISISANTVAWCIFGYRYFSFLLLIVTTRLSSIKVFA